MDHVLDNFRDPIGCKSDENQKSNDLSLATAATTGSTTWIPWIVFRVYRNECHGEPCGIGSGNQPANQGDYENMSIVLRDVDHGLEHQNRKGYPWDPAYEAYDIEDREDDEDNGCGIPMSQEVYDRSADAKDDL
jgi:hypothetical protein